MHCSSGHRRGLLSDGQLQQAHPAWGPLGTAQHQFLVALVPPASQEKISEVQQQLAGVGGWVASYLPDDALLCIGKSSSADFLRTLPEVAWVVSAFPYHVQVGVSACHRHVWAFCWLSHVPPPALVYAWCVYLQFVHVSDVLSAFTCIHKNVHPRIWDAYGTVRFLGAMPPLKCIHVAAKSLCSLWLGCPIAVFRQPTFIFPCI
jgi:hypothetical protein